MLGIIKKIVKKKFSSAGISINGNLPWDIRVNDDRFYAKMLQGSFGMGEAYMEGYFDCQRLDECVTKILNAKLDRKHFNWLASIAGIISIFMNKQSRKRAFEVGQRHYDIGNDLFECMLDKRMTYSCGYWKDAKNLDEAQEAKLDLVCKKLYLRPGMKVLDIGCGWGSFAKFAAEKYQVSVLGISVSEQQLNLLQEKCKGLPIDYRLQDYRDLNDRQIFDRVVSIGQMEHVGYKNYGTYMRIADRVLKDDGLFLLHTIGSLSTETSGDPWIEKYIFPNGMLPSMLQLSKASEDLFVMEDWHNFGAYYDTTLMAWFQNFDNNWDKLKFHYDEKFYRMWKYYLLSCAGYFRSRRGQLWQIVFSKHGVPGGYLSIR